MDRRTLQDGEKEHCWSKKGGEVFAALATAQEYLECNQDNERGQAVKSLKSILLSMRMEGDIPEEEMKMIMAKFSDLNQEKSRPYPYIQKLIRDIEQCLIPVETSLNKLISTYKEMEREREKQNKPFNPERWWRAVNSLIELLTKEQKIQIKKILHEIAEDREKLEALQINGGDIEVIINAVNAVVKRIIQKP